MKYVIQTNEGVAVVIVANEDKVNVSEVILKDTGASEYIEMTEEELKAKPFVFTSTIANGELFVDTYRTKEFLKGIAQGKKKQEVMEATNDGELQVIIAKYANIEVSINNASNEAELLEVFNGMN